MMKLDLNEVPYQIKIEASKLELTDLHRYQSQSFFELKTALSEMNSIPFENIAITIGADGAIDNLMQIFKKTCGKIYLPSPSYEGYQFFAERQGWNIELYEIKNTARTLRCAESNEVVVICNPVNPTGEILNGLESSLALSKAKVIIDEAYIECCQQISPLIQFSAYSNVFLIRTFSKVFAAPGIRVGYVLSPVSLKEISPLFEIPFGVSQFNLKYALELLKNVTSVKDQLALTLQRTRGLVLLLRRWGFRVSETSTYFFTIELSDLTQAQSFFKKLLENDIQVKPIQGTSWVRVTCPNVQDEKRFVDVVEKLRWHFCNPEGQIIDIH